jgi:hypothetical protein
MFDKIWVNNDVENKVVFKNEISYYEEMGYKPGDL